MVGWNVRRMKYEGNRDWIRLNLHIAGQRIEFSFAGHFIPNFHFVVSMRQMINLEASVIRRDCEIRSGNGNDGRTHFRMDITKNVRYSGLGKSHLSDHPTLVEP